MVKGISRQVIVVQSPDPKMFEQAIFILKEEVAGGEGITDEMLLKEANRLIRNEGSCRKRKAHLYGPVWAAAGAVVTGVVWAVCCFL